MNNEEYIIGYKLALKPRYAIIESYYGKFDQDCIIASTTCLQDGSTIIDALVEKYKGRPIKYKLKKIDTEYFEGLDDIITEDLFGNKKDYTKYIKGVDCINVK